MMLGGASRVDFLLFALIGDFAPRLPADRLRFDLPLDPVPLFFDFNSSRICSNCYILSIWHMTVSLRSLYSSPLTFGVA